MSSSHHCLCIITCVLQMVEEQFWFWFWFYTPLLKEITETVVPDSCSQVSMEMIVMGEYVCVEGRYGKAFIKESELVCGTPIHVFPMDEDCMGCGNHSPSKCNVLGIGLNHCSMVQCKLSVRYRARKSSRYL